MVVVITRSLYHFKWRLFCLFLFTVTQSIIARVSLRMRENGSAMIASSCSPPYLKHRWGAGLAGSQGVLNTPHNLFIKINFSSFKSFSSFFVFFSGRLRCKTWVESRLDLAGSRSYSVACVRCIFTVFWRWRRGSGGCGGSRFRRRLLGAIT